MNEAARNATSNRLTLASIEIELIDRGSGAPILYLHGGAGTGRDLPFIELLAKTHRVIAPSHPGFGPSTLPDWMDSVDDIAHVYLELLDRLGLRNVDLVGMSFGGWVADEMATKMPERIARVVLIGPVGVKTGSVDKLDMPDMFAMPQDKVDRLRYHDAAKYRPNVET